VLASVGACSNSDAPCASPSTGTFAVSLSYARTIPVSIYCGGGGPEDGAVADAAPDATLDSAADAAPDASSAAVDAGSCASRPHPFDKASWSVAVTGSGAMVTPKGGAPWTCTAIGPKSPPGSAPDGAPVPATGCYLLVTCDAQTAGDAGSAGLQLQIFAQSSTDVLVLAHDDSGSCCTDEYTGTWQ
jgi:hypothetical protein